MFAGGRVAWRPPWVLPPTCAPPQDRSPECNEAPTHAGNAVVTTLVPGPVGLAVAGQAAARDAPAAVRGRGLLLAGGHASGLGLFRPAGADRVAGAAGHRDRRRASAGAAPAVPAAGRAAAVAGHAHRRARIRPGGRLAGGHLRDVAAAGRHP